MSVFVRRTSPGRAPHGHNAAAGRHTLSFAGPVPDQSSHGLLTWTTGVDFEPHRIGSPDEECQVVYRNWRPKAKPNFRKHVLVLDNDQQFLQILGQLLDDERYNVTLASRPLSHALVTRLRPDVVIADATLGHHLRGLSPDGQPQARADGMTIPVIYTTMLPSAAADSWPGDAGVLIKPFDLDDLLELIVNATS